jgi:hypothetical protein
MVQRPEASPVPATPTDDERLKAYCLPKEHAKPTDLVVSEGERIRISAREPGRFSGNTHAIPVKSVNELKRMIGIPDSVAQSHSKCAILEGLSETIPGTFRNLSDLSSSQREVLRRASDAYIHGLSTAVSVYSPAIDKAIALSPAAIIGIVTFADITVERGGVLLVDPSVSVLYANKILIKLGGRIRALGRLKIDCSSMQGEEPFVNRAVGTRSIVA